MEWTEIFRVSTEVVGANALAAGLIYALRDRFTLLRMGAIVAGLIAGAELAIGVIGLGALLDRFTGLALTEGAIYLGLPSIPVIGAIHFFRRSANPTASTWRYPVMALSLSWSATTLGFILVYRFKG